MSFSLPMGEFIHLPSIKIMVLYGRMRSLTDEVGFTGTLPAICQCSDESQSIQEALFGYS